MKKFLEFSGIIAAGLALIAFIFMLAGNGLVYRYGNTANFVPGTTLIFGGNHITLAATALIAWIFILLAFLVLAVLFVLPLLKVNALDKFAGIITLCAAGALLIAGILLFVSKAAFNGANNNIYNSYSLTFAFVFAGILAILGSLVAACPVVLKLIGKDK